jgi:hypothetical protein
MRRRSAVFALAYFENQATSTRMRGYARRALPLELVQSAHRKMGQAARTSADSTGSRRTAFSRPWYARCAGLRCEDS